MSAEFQRALDGAGPYSACSQNTVGWFYPFWSDEVDNPFAWEPEIMLAIVYDLDKY